MKCQKKRVLYLFIFAKNVCYFNIQFSSTCLILHPKDNTPETLSLVKKINRTVILINTLNIVLLGIVIYTITIVRK